MSSAIAGPVSFGLIPRDHWFQPDWIDEEKAAAGRAQMAADGVVYGCWEDETRDRRWAKVRDWWYG